MKLSIIQKREMYENGFVRIPGAIPQAMVREALRAINFSLVSEGIPPEKLPTFHAQSFCPELRESGVIVDLFNKTPVVDCVESLLGPGMVRPAGQGQMALRFPGYADPPKVHSPHIDGTYSPTNGVPAGTVAHFNLLAAVFLSDVPAPFCGNFAVWPGTHRKFEKHFQENDPAKLAQGLPKIDMPEPTQVMAQAGDVVLAHYLLAHSVAPNISPNIRYAVFFRVHHRDHSRENFLPMTNMWGHWPGMRDVLPEEDKARIIEPAAR